MALLGTRRAILAPAKGVAPLIAKNLILTSKNLTLSGKNLILRTH